MIATRAASTRSLLAALERALFVLAVILIGWFLFQQAFTVYYQAVSNRELEAIRMPVRSEGAPQRRTVPLGTLVGRIEIPRVGVSAIVREGDDTSTLRRSVGHIPETALPGQAGNTGLAGHRDTFFRGLRNVRSGDRVLVTTPAAVVQYVVRTTRVVDPNDVSVLEPTPRETLTLVTCYPFSYIGAAPKRYIVQAELVEDRPQ